MQGSIHVRTTGPYDLGLSTTDNTLTTEHIVTLTGLGSNTLYYYRIGSTTEALQGDANNFFRTMPENNSHSKIRVLVMGDMGANTATQVNVKNAWNAFNGKNYTDAWLLLGDNAYTNGTDTEYQNNFFNIYQGSLTKNHVLWPAPGNHDYANNPLRQADHAIPYYDIFSLPANGQAGGVPSSTEAYYSFDYGNVHFVALDSYGWETGNTRLYDTLGRQAVWLKQDLSANTKPWTIVYFHHPPYTKGSHDSDTEIELVSMRQKIVPILERYKVDLVLAGHSHSYERSYLLNGHYGPENTFSLSSHALSSSSGRYDGTSDSCPYTKNDTDIRNGIVYAVVGSSGKLEGSSAAYPHDAMYYSNVANAGALYFEVDSNRLNARWVGSDGVIRDNFTIMKNAGRTSNLSKSSVNGTKLTASWNGDFIWSTGETTKIITVDPVLNTTYTVTDGTGCLTDTFNVEVTASLQSAVPEELQSKSIFNLYPTILSNGETINIQLGEKEVAEFSVINTHGRILGKFTFEENTQAQMNTLVPGVYYIRIRTEHQTITRKILIRN